MAAGRWLMRTIEMNDNAKNRGVRTLEVPGTRNETREDAKRTDSKEEPPAPKPSDAPPRDTRESPAPNPDGDEPAEPKTGSAA
jgi:hypothetical protein